MEIMLGLISEWRSGVALLTVGLIIVLYFPFHVWLNDKMFGKENMDMLRRKGWCG